VAFRPSLAGSSAFSGEIKEWSIKYSPIRDSKESNDSATPPSREICPKMNSYLFVLVVALSALTMWRVRRGRREDSNHARNAS
jgi:hypothetical protein